MLKDNGEIYTNGEENYYSFFEKLILAIGGEPNAGLETRISVLEKWREDEIDPYVKKLKTYQYKANSNNIDFNEELIIGSNNVILNEGNDRLNENSEIWANNYNKVGSMKALNDLADYCSALKKQLDSFYGSLIHIGKKDPDSEGKTSCKVWLNTNKDNGNGIIYYRTLSTADLPALNAATEEQIKAANLWIPVSAVWSAKQDETLEEEEEDNAVVNNKTEYTVLGAINIGEIVKLGNMTFRVVHKGYPSSPTGIASNVYAWNAINYATDDAESDDEIYYHSDLQKGVWLIWEPDTLEEKDRGWVNNNGESVHIVKISYSSTAYNIPEKIQSSLDGLGSLLKNKYDKNLFVKLLRYDERYDANYDKIIHLPNYAYLFPSVDSTFHGSDSGRSCSFDYFKQNNPIFFADYATEYLNNYITKNGGQGRIEKDEEKQLVLRPIIILDGYNSKLYKQDGTYYLQEKGG